MAEPTYATGGYLPEDWAYQATGGPVEVFGPPVPTLYLINEPTPVTFATYDEARAAWDAQYRDAASRVAAHARLVAKRLSDGIAATHPGYYFEYDDSEVTREQRDVIADPGT